MRHVKKITKIATPALTLTVLWVFASPLMAQMTIEIKGYGDLRRGSGGEFTFINPDGWDPLDYYRTAGPAAVYKNGIQTFCLERGEHLWRNTTYNVELSLAAKNGGKNSDPQAPAGVDNLSKGSAWLYEQFAKGTLDGYSYETATKADRRARKNSAYSLQVALWYLEDEIKQSDERKFKIDSNIFLNLAKDHFSTDSFDLLKEDYTGTAVAVMNLTRLNGSRAQDQIVLANVPAPGALVLAAIGVGITAIRNRTRIP